MCRVGDSHVGWGRLSWVWRYSLGRGQSAGPHVSLVCVCMYVCVHLSVCLYVCVCISVCVHLCVHVSVCTYVFVYLCLVCLCARLLVCKHVAHSLICTKVPGSLGGRGLREGPEREEGWGARLPRRPG